MRGLTGWTRRRGFLAGAVLALVAAGVIVVAATATSSQTQRVAVLKHTFASADSCGYSGTATSPTAPRDTVLFAESTTVKAFSPAGAGIVGEDFKVYYSDEHALTAGGVGTTPYNGSLHLVIPPGTLGQGDDPLARPLRPVLYATDLTVNGLNSRAGDWQNNGTPLGDPNDIFGTWKPSNASDPAKNNTNVDGETWPSGLSHEGYTSVILWKTNTLGLQAGHVYRLQAMVHDGDQNKTGGDVGEVCTTIQSPQSTTSATPEVQFGGTIVDVLHIHGILPTTTGTVVFKAFAPLTPGGNDANCNGPAEYTSNPIPIHGDGDYTSSPLFTPTKTGTYKWGANVQLSPNFLQQLDCGDTSGGNSEISHVTIPPTTTSTGQKVTVKDKAKVNGFTSGSNGTVRFRLYDSLLTCQAAGTNGIVYDSGPLPVQQSGIDKGTALSGDVAVQNQTNADKTFYWLVNFSGDAYNGASESSCGKETFTIHPDGSGLDP